MSKCWPLRHLVNPCFRAHETFPSEEPANSTGVRGGSARSGVNPPAAIAAQRAGALGVGLLSGGYGSEELQAAGAYRVYDDPAGLLGHLDELGVRAGGSAGDR